MFVYFFFLNRFFFFFFFFFSSRRRHTRWTGDWSSDVCSSDLFARSLGQGADFGSDEMPAALRQRGDVCRGGGIRVHRVVHRGGRQHRSIGAREQQRGEQIVGRSEERRVGKGCRSRGPPWDVTR